MSKIIKNSIITLHSLNFKWFRRIRRRLFQSFELIYRKYFIGKDYRLAVFLWLTILVFIIYRKSLGLTLYGDDWLVISKYLGGYGPEKDFGYFDPRVWISNYGFQYSIGVLYPFLGQNHVYYFIISLFCRIILAYTIFLLVRETFSFRTAFLSSTFFAVTIIGAETTDYVYNFNSYLGISIAILGLRNYIKADDNYKKVKAWLLIVLGYIVVPIRLFILPLTMFFLILVKELDKKKSFKIKGLPKLLLISASGFLPFLILKYIDPFIGWQSNLTYIVREGINSGMEMVFQGRYDLFLTPFITLGKALIPIGPLELQKLGWQIYPMNRFVVYGGILAVLGTVLIVGYYKKFKIIFSALVSLSVIILLKIFVREQGEWLLKDFSFFSWTYLGLILTFVLLISLFNILSEKSLKKLMIILVGFIFTASFLFPWIYNPGTIFDPHHRYLILTSVGISILISTSIFPNDTLSRKHLMVKYLLFFTILLIQVVSVDKYITLQLKGRNRELNDRVFNQIKNEIPVIPTDNASVFYFENFDPLVYESLLRASFGYHMQLIYNFKFDEQILPFSVSNISDLEKAVKDDNFTKQLGYKKPDIDHVFAYKWLNGEMINITKETRNQLNLIR